MARSYAKLLTRIWHNKDFCALDAGPQRLFMTAISQDTLNCCGVTPYTPTRLARLAKDTTPRSIVRDILALEGRWLVSDSETEELWVVPFLKWDGVLRQPNSIRTMSRDFVTIHSEAIRQGVVDYFADEYDGGFATWVIEQFPNAFPHGTPDGIADGFLDAIGEPKGDGYPDPKGDGCGFGTEVPSPSPESFSEVRSPGGDAPAGDVLLRNGETGLLAARMAAACRPNNRAAAETEAVGVVAWALRYVDHKLIEEAIAWAEEKSRGPKPVSLPRAIAGVIFDKACDHGNTRIRAYNPSLVLSYLEGGAA